MNDLTVESIPIKHNPWDRSPGESDAAWEAYRRYRNMPSSKRNITALKTILVKERDAAEDAGEFDNVPTIRYPTLNSWAQEYHWVQRTAAWDAEVDRVWQEEGKLAIRDAARRHWESGVELQNVGKAALQFINPGTLAEKAPQEVRRFIETGTDIERKALGMSEKETQQVAGNAVLIIQIVEQLEKQLMGNNTPILEGEFTEVEEVVVEEIEVEEEESV